MKLWIGIAGAVTLLVAIVVIVLRLKKARGIF